MFNIEDYMLVQGSDNGHVCKGCVFHTHGTNICSVETQKEFHTCVTECKKVWVKKLVNDKKGETKMNVKTIETVNVMLTDNGSGDVTFYAFPNTEQGNKDAKGCFKACVQKLGVQYQESMYENGFVQGVFQIVVVEMIASTTAGTIEKAKSVDKMIHEYVRDIYDNKVGVFVAIGNCEDGYTVGWSKANINAGDDFDKEFGLKLAIQRANDEQDATELPDSFLDFFRYFINRCDRYFKQGDYKV